jgi:hypothetical protein
MIRMTLAAIGAILMLGLIIFVDYKHPTVVQYDCRLSEISPDFPIDVREQCRKLRATKLK